MEPDQLALLREVLQDRTPSGPPPPDRVRSVLTRAAQRRRRSHIGATVLVSVAAIGTVIGVKATSAGTGSAGHAAPLSARPAATSAAATGSALPPPTLTRSTTPAPERTGGTGDLLGRTWVLSDVRAGGATTSSPAAIHLPGIPFLRFAADGTYQGSDGCNGIAGSYTLDSGVLRLHLALTTYADCLGENTNVFHRVANGPMSLTLSAEVNRMTLMAPNQELLEFRSKT